MPQTRHRIPASRTLPVPREHKWELLGIYIRSFLGNLTVSKISDLADSAVVDFFNARYRTNENMRVTDGNSGWYFAPLEEFESVLRQIPSSPDIRVLDLGCGNGSVLRWLRQKGFAWHYTGIDIASDAAPYFESDPDAAFIVHDVRDIKSLPVPENVRIVFAVNCFSYVENPAPVLRRLHEIAATDALLVIIDSHPSCYWNRRVRFHIRKTATWIKALGRLGWAIETRTCLGIFSLGSRPVLPISQAFLCRKSTANTTPTAKPSVGER